MSSAPRTAASRATQRHTRPTPAPLQMSCLTQTADYGVFQLGPLDRGYGAALGTALRRVLLSSLRGTAVTAVQIAGASHEFTSLPHIREDVAQIILQLKQIRFRSQVEYPLEVTLSVRGPTIATAGACACPPVLSIINPTLPLATLDSSAAQLDLILRVEGGRGYTPGEPTFSRPLGVLPVDALFSPVETVMCVVTPLPASAVEAEQLTLQIWTNQTISPEEALREAAGILLQHWTLFQRPWSVSTAPDEEGRGGHLIDPDYFHLPLETLDLSIRTLNALRRVPLASVGEVLALEQDELAGIRGFGVSCLAELTRRLQVGGYLPSA